MIGPPNRQLYTKSLMEKVREDMEKTEPEEYSRAEKRAEAAAKNKSLLDRLFFKSD